MFVVLLNGCRTSYNARFYCTLKFTLKYLFIVLCRTQFNLLCKHWYLKSQEAVGKAYRRTSTSAAGLLAREEGPGRRGSPEANECPLVTWDWSPWEPQRAAAPWATVPWAELGAPTPGCSSVSWPHSWPRLGGHEVPCLHCTWEETCTGTIEQTHLRVGRRLAIGKTFQCIFTEQSQPSL